MTDQRNLRFETQIRATSGGALIVYCPDELRGVTLNLLEPFNIWEGSWLPHAYASVIRRTVNGETGFSAWFPQVKPNHYVICRDVPEPQKNNIESRGEGLYSTWVTIYNREVTEVDWRLD